MMSRVGRRREHDQATALALLEAAERIAATEGIDGVSVRALALDAGVSTRAIYSLFDSKDGLVAALGARAFDVLADTVSSLPTTTDPANDLVEAGVRGFRPFVTAHPALFALGIQQGGSTPEQRAVIRASAARAFLVLEALAGRVATGDGRPRHAATAFHAMCEGLAALELRCVLATDEAEEVWREALTALVAGLATPRT